MIETARLGARLGGVVFPLDLYDLAAEVTRLGFILRHAMPPKQPTPLSVAGGVANPFAGRGDIVLDVDTNKRVIGTTGLPLSDLVSGYQEIFSIFNRLIGSEPSVQFHEFSARFQVNCDNSPAQSLAKAFLNTPTVKEIGQKLGIDLSVFGFKLRDSHAMSNEPEYFEIQVEPNMLLPNKILMATMIYRSESLADVVGKCGDLASKAEAVLSQIASLL
jgi:hypothetical protein